MESERCKAEDPKDTWPYTQRCPNNSAPDSKVCESHKDLYTTLGIKFEED